MLACAVEDAWNPISVIGELSWANYQVSVDVFIETKGFVGVGARVGQTGQDVAKAVGVFFFLDDSGSLLIRFESSIRCDAGGWSVSSDIAHRVILASGRVNAGPQQWHTMVISVSDNSAQGFFDKSSTALFSITLPASIKTGFAAIVSSFAYVWHDNFAVRPL